MIVDESTEDYLIHSMGLTKEQIEEMLPSEIDKHCDEVIQKRIDARGMVRKKENQLIENNITFFYVINFIINFLYTKIFLYKLPDFWF
jgi:hypothetical protein